MRLPCRMALVMSFLAKSKCKYVFRFMDSRDRTCNRTWNPIPDDAGTCTPAPTWPQGAEGEKAFLC